MQKGIDIIPYNFESERIKGLYCDSTIALSTSIRNTAEKACILAEEVGHHETTSGDILNQQSMSNLKQERHARIWAYDKLISLFGIVRAHNAGCRNSFEMAEYLEVTEEFLSEALETYKSKYGTSAVKADEYIIIFDPTLTVMKMPSN